MTQSQSNLFAASRRRLTLLYSLVMMIFLVLVVLIMHKTMEWAIMSEQARELMDTASNIAQAQGRGARPILDDSVVYKSTNDRLFFYVFDSGGRLTNFSRASYRIEPFILDVIAKWNSPDGEVSVFAKPGDATQNTRLMMTEKKIPAGNNGRFITVFVGKDVTAMYNGLEKATYALTLLGLCALIVAAVVGHMLSGRAMLPLRESYERQKQFAADASHELRTPLSVVMASAELMLNDPSIKSPFLRQVLEDVRDEVKKMTKLVGDLLVIARSDNKALQLKLTKCDLYAFVEQAARMMQPLAEKKHIQIGTEAASAEGKSEIQADAQKIRQLILILADNAVKYTPEDGRVTIGLSPAEKGKISFFVRDTGIGISEEDQARVFDRFFRVDKARSREMGGNGLGLAIAQEIVKLHKGTISIDSTLGKGTTFSVTLRTKLKS